MPNEKPLYLTLSGLPLSFEFNWPFHKSTSGADFHVLHGTAWLEDGGGLRADFSIHLTQTMMDMLPSQESEKAQPYVLNVIRRMTDTKDVEFLKSGKRQPMPLSSRFKNFKRNSWHFTTSTPEETERFLEHSVYWIAVKLGRGRMRVNDPANALYLDTDAEQLFRAAQRIVTKGLIRIEGEFAVPTDAMVSRAAEYEQAEQEALTRLQEKHAFESVHKH